jgi:hypothetical protein
VIDLAAHADEFRAQGELISRAGAIPADRLAELQREAARLDPEATRVHVPLVRSGGTVGARRLREAAPAMIAIYRELAAVAARLVGRPLYEKHDDDDHGVALYSYRAGDFMRAHFDRCGCAEGSSYSVTVGIVDDSTSRLECRLADGRALALATPPGSLTIYNGSRVHHGVSRLGAGQRRIVLSGSYRITPEKDPVRHLVQRVTDGLLYYGLRGLAPRRR